MPPTRTLAVDIRTFRKALRQLDRALDRLAKADMPTNGAKPRRKLHLSPERRAALKLHGQYLGYLRGLKPRQKSQVKKIREAKGVRAAVAAAKRLAR